MFKSNSIRPIDGKLIRLAIFALFLLFEFRGSAQNDAILSRHLSRHGGEKQLEQISSVFANGTIEIKSMGLTFPFNIRSKGKLFRFEQEELQRGMDLVPAIVRLINDKAWAIMDERSLNRGYQIRDHGERALQLWNETEFTLPTPLLHYLRQGYEMAPSKNLSDGSIELQFELPSKEHGTFRFAPSGTLLTHQFTGYHIQLGKVNVTRNFLSYTEKEGIRYPDQWVDDRNGLKLHYKIEEIEFNTVDDSVFEMPGKSNDTYVSAKTAQTILKSYLDKLEKESPFPGKTQLLLAQKDELLTSIRKRKKLTFNALSQALTDELIRRTEDHHFGIEYNPDLFDQLTNEQVSTDNGSYFDRVAKHTREQNFFFRDVSLEDGLFYFHLSEFGLLETTKNYFDSLMQVAQQARGIVIDLRNNSGGDGDFAHYMASYFLPEKTRLYTNVTKAGKRDIYASSTSASKNHRSIPVFVLVNEYTVSAGELVPYLLQNHNRAQVIGTTTYGAAHPSIDVPLVSGFIGLVPVAYSEHVQTGEDWEGKGVTPDVSCAAEEALQVVKQLAMKKQ